MQGPKATIVVLGKSCLTQITVTNCWEKSCSNSTNISPMICKGMNLRPGMVFSMPTNTLVTTPSPNNFQNKSGNAFNASTYWKKFEIENFLDFAVTLQTQSIRRLEAHVVLAWRHLVTVATPRHRLPTRRERNAAFNRPLPQQLKMLIVKQSILALV